MAISYPCCELPEAVTLNTELTIAKTPITITPILTVFLWFFKKSFVLLKDLTFTTLWSLGESIFMGSMFTLINTCIWNTKGLIKKRTQLILTAPSRNFNWLMLKINCKITQQQPQQPTTLQFSCRHPTLSWPVTVFLWSKLMPFKNSATPPLSLFIPLSLHLIWLATPSALKASSANNNLLLVLSVIEHLTEGMAETLGLLSRHQDQEPESQQLLSFVWP